LVQTEVRQRLAAILAADAAGYSRHMASDERATVAALDSARSIFREMVGAHQGRIIDTAGDSVLAVFDAATGAVAAALAAQEALFARDAAVPDDRRLRFRIGVHLGDVMVQADGSVYGNGVNVAARLQALADAGGIMISAAVHEAVRGKLAASFTDLGAQRLKNIDAPVHIFRVQVAGAAPPARRASTWTKVLVVTLVGAGFGIAAIAYRTSQPPAEGRSWSTPVLMRAQGKPDPGEASREKVEIAAAPAKKEHAAEKAAARKIEVAAVKAAPTEVPGAPVKPGAVASATPSPGGSDAQFEQAVAMEASDPRAAVKIYRLLARNGNAKAARRLGEIYDRGLPGIARDYQESLAWYQKARELGEQTEPVERARR